MIEKSQIKLVLAGEGVDQDDIALHTRALQEMLEDALPEAEVAQATRQRAPGEKGDPVTLGAIVIGLITSGVVKAMIDCIGALIARDKRLTIDLVLEDGRHIKVDATNIGDEKIKDTLKKVL